MKKGLIYAALFSGLLGLSNIFSYNSGKNQGFNQGVDSGRRAIVERYQNASEIMSDVIEDIDSSPSKLSEYRIWADFAGYNPDEYIEGFREDAEMIKKFSLGLEQITNEDLMKTISKE